MTMPDAAIGCVANLWSKQMHFKKLGDTEQGHSHKFDHLTLLASGSLQVIVDGAVSEFKAPQMIYIEAGKVHELIALEDNTVAYCIHALRDDEGIILDPSMIPAGINKDNVFNYASTLITK
jgi:mannose-6-phosphate isomerase-like protein (cupin superfamily)